MQIKSQVNLDDGIYSLDGRKNSGIIGANKMNTSPTRKQKAAFSYTNPMHVKSQNSFA